MSNPQEIGVVVTENEFGLGRERSSYRKRDNSSSGVSFTQSELSSLGGKGLAVTYSSPFRTNRSHISGRALALMTLWGP